MKLKKQNSRYQSHAEHQAIVDVQCMDGERKSALSAMLPLTSLDDSEAIKFILLRLSEDWYFGKC
jgi:hypothetical protein